MTMISSDGFSQFTGIGWSNMCSGHIAHKAGVEQRRLIRGGLATSDQRAPTRGSILFELFPQRLEQWTRQRSNGPAEAVQNIALEELAHIRRQVLGPSRRGKCDDAFDCWTRLFPALT
jgi:hypothetical protein